MAYIAERTTPVDAITALESARADVVGEVAFDGSMKAFLPAPALQADSNLGVYCAVSSAASV